MLNIYHHFHKIKSVNEDENKLTFADILHISAT